MTRAPRAANALAVSLPMPVRKAGTGYVTTRQDNAAGAVSRSGNSLLSAVRQIKKHTCGAAACWPRAALAKHSHGVGAAERLAAERWAACLARQGGGEDRWASLIGRLLTKSKRHAHIFHSVPGVYADAATRVRMVLNFDLMSVGALLEYRAMQ